jgi:hypothetical protein
MKKELKSIVLGTGMLLSMASGLEAQTEQNYERGLLNLTGNVESVQEVRLFGNYRIRQRVYSRDYKTQDSIEEQKEKDSLAKPLPDYVKPRKEPEKRTERNEGSEKKPEYSEGKREEKSIESEIVNPMIEPLIYLFKSFFK